MVVIIICIFMRLIFLVELEMNFSLGWILGQLINLAGCKRVWARSESPGEVNFLYEMQLLAGNSNLLQEINEATVKMHRLLYKCN